MILPDVNVLVYAFRPDTSNHKAYRNWLTKIVNSDELFGLSELALSSFLRVVTHPRVFDPPEPADSALAFADALRRRSNCALISPGPSHWDIFVRLIRSSGVKGNVVSDAYFAALAIESGCEWITTDRDYSRFEGLKWRHPLA